MKKTLMRVLSMVLIVCMLLPSVPAMALTGGSGDGSQSKSKYGNEYDTSILEAIDEIGGYDAYAVMDSLYEAGVVDETGHQNENATFLVNGETVDRETLAEMAEAEDADTAVVIDGEEMTWGEVQNALELCDTLDVIDEIRNDEFEMTEEHVANLLGLLQEFAKGSLYLGNYRITGESSTVPAEAVTSGDLTLGTDANTGKKYITGAYAGTGGYQTDYAFTLTNQAATKWFTLATTNGSGIDTSVKVNVTGLASSVAQNGSFTVTLTLSAEQNAPVTLNYRVVAGSWSVATVDGTGTITWEAGDTSAKTFTVSAGNGGNTFNGNHFFGVQLYNLTNATFANGKTTREQVVSVAGNMTYAQTKTFNVTVDINNYVQIGKFFDDNLTYNLAITAKSAVYARGLDKSSLTINVDLKYKYGSNEEFIARKTEFMQSQGGSSSDSRNTSISKTITKKGSVLNNSEVALMIPNTNGNGCGGGAIDDAEFTFTASVVDPTTPATIQSISIPTGDFYPGQTVPITMTLDKDVYVGNSNAVSVTANGETLYQKERNAYGNTLTFLYTVKDVDTGSISLSQASGTVKTTGSKSSISVEGFAANKVTGTATLKTPDKAQSFTAYKIGIDDALPSKQTVAAELTINTTDKAYYTWIVQSDNVEIMTNSVELTDASGNKRTVTSYVKGMYVTYDGGKTRYPLYIVTEGAEGKPVALLANLCPPMNVSSEIRMDTVEVFYNPTLGAATDYITNDTTVGTDKGGFTYYTAGENTPSAILLPASQTKVYVKGGIFLSDSYLYYKEGEAYSDGQDLTLDYSDAWDTYLEKATKTEKITGYATGLDKAAGKTTEYERSVIEYYAETNEDFHIDRVIHDRVADAEQVFGADDFTFTDPKWFHWVSSDESIATVDDEGYITFTGKQGSVYFILDVLNGDVADYQYYIYSNIIYVKAGQTPFLSVSKNAQNKVVLQSTAAKLYFSSNLTARNVANSGKDDYATDFTATLYKYVKGTVGNTLDVAAVQALEKVADYTVTSTTGDEKCCIEIPGEQFAEKLTSGNVGNGLDNYDYIVLFSATDVEHPETPLYAYTKLYIKPQPAKATLTALDNYFQLDDVLEDESFAITYTFQNLVKGADAYYTVQKSGEEPVKTVIEPDAEGNLPATGTIPTSVFEHVSGELKEIYTVSLYVRNTDADEYAVDSFTLYLYNSHAIELVVTAATRGEIGGTTGGKAESTIASDYDSVDLENISYIESMLKGETRGSIEVDGTVISIEKLQKEINLQAVISINYSDYVWGMISDQIAWESSDSDVATVEYYQGGLYSNIEDYSYVSYLPATDFLLGGHTEGSAVIKATHARTGMEDSILVNVERLDNKLYLFRFLPEQEVEVTYTTMIDGVETEQTVNSNANGELVLYEPEGIVSDVYVMSTDHAYVGTIRNDVLLSGEQNVSALQVYPCNNLKLRKISEVEIYVQKPDGTPYVGEVTLHGGVFKNDYYCPNACFATTDHATVDLSGVDGFTATTDAKGCILLRMDASQFNTQAEIEAETNYGASFTDTVTYVFELTVDGYRQDVLQIETATDEELKTNVSYGVSVLQTRDADAVAPYVAHKSVRQYVQLSSGEYEASDYTTDMTRDKGVTGPSYSYPQVILDDMVIFDGYQGEQTEGKYPTLKAVPKELQNAAIVLRDTNGVEMEGQLTKGTALTAVTNLNDISTANEDSTVAVYIYPFSTVPLGRNTYTMNAETFGKQEERVTVYDEEMRASYETWKYTYLDAYEEIGFYTEIYTDYTTGKPVVTELSDFRIANQLDQKPIDGEESELYILVQKANDMLYSSTDLMGTLEGDGISEFLKLPLNFISGLVYEGGAKLNTTIFPTADPSHFYILFEPVSLLDLNAAGSITVSTEKMTSVTDILAEQDVWTGTGATSLNFSGFYIAEAIYSPATGWGLDIVSGHMEASTPQIGKNFNFNTMAGPIPITFSIGVGGGLALSYTYQTRTDEVTREKLMDALQDITLRVYIYAFGGIGVSNAIFTLKVGVYGRIGVNTTVSILYDARNNETYNGTNVSLDGEAGISFSAGVGILVYTKEIALWSGSISGMNAGTDSYEMYEKIHAYWDANGDYAKLKGTTLEGGTYTASLVGDDILFEVSSCSVQDRNYLTGFTRENVYRDELLQEWNKETTKAYVETLQTNAYPYANPVFTDDGAFMLYLSDMDYSAEAVSAVAYADIEKNPMADKGTVTEYQYVLKAGTQYYAEGDLNYSVAKTTADTNIELLRYYMEYMLKSGTAYYESENADQAKATVGEDTVISLIRYDADKNTAVITLDGDETEYVVKNVNYGETTAVISVEDRALIKLDDTEYIVRDVVTGTGSKIALYAVEGEERVAATARNASGLVASGTNGNYFAAWVCQTQSMSKEVGETADTADLAQMMNSNEIMVSMYNAAEEKWVTTRLTDDDYSDTAVRLASNGDKAIAVWQRGASSDNPLKMDIEETLCYSIYDGSKWSEIRTAYSAVDESITNFDVAMTSDGTALISMTLDTGAMDTETDSSSYDTETAYVLIDTNNNKSVYRITNNSEIDCGAQVEVVKRIPTGKETEEEQFVLVWLNAKQASDSEERNIRLAAVDTKGNMDTGFVECISGNESLSVTDNFTLVGSAETQELTDLYIVWSETPKTDTQSEETVASKDILKAVRFYELEGVQGVTAPITVMEMPAGRITVDHFDTYVDSEADQVKAVILASDYTDTIARKIGTIEIEQMVENGQMVESDYENNLLELVGADPIRNLYAADLQILECDYSVSEAGYSFDAVDPGFPMTVSFEVTNTGSTTLKKAVVTVDGKEYTFDNLTILPGKTQKLTLECSVPSTNIHDMAYTVKMMNGEQEIACSDKSNSGTIVINRPDVGVTSLSVVSESDGKRTLEVELTNTSVIPLENDTENAKVVKLGFYKDSECKSAIGEVLTIPASDYWSIDKGTYRKQVTFNVDDMVTLVEGELPEDGFQVYAKVWIEEQDESHTTFDEENTANNIVNCKLESPLAKYEEQTFDSEKRMVNAGITLAADKLTLNLRYLSLKEATYGNIRVYLLDENGAQIGYAETFDFSNTETPEAISAQYMTFTQEEEKTLTLAVHYNDGKTAEDVKDYEVVLYETKYDFYYTWDSDDNPAVTNTPDTTHGYYTEATNYVFGQKTEDPAATIAQGERKFLGWHRVLGYTDSETGDTYLLSDGSITAEELAGTDFFNNKSYKKILEAVEYDFTTQHVEGDTVLYAAFASIQMNYTEDIEASYGDVIDTEFDLVYPGGTFKGLKTGDDITAWFSEEAQASKLTFTVKAINETGNTLTISVKGIVRTVYFEDNNPAKAIVNTSLTFTCPADKVSGGSEVIGPSNTAMTMKFTKRKITVTTASATKVYDGTALTAPTYTKTGVFALNDTLSINYTAEVTHVAEGEVSNTAEIRMSNVTVTGEGKNEKSVQTDVTDYYEIDFTAGTLRITPKHIELAWRETAESDATTGDISYQYNGEDQKPVVKVSDGLVDGEKEEGLNLTVAVKKGTTDVTNTGYKNAGTYTVKVTLPENSDYTFADTDEAGVTAAAVSEKEYTITKIELEKPEIAAEQNLVYEPGDNYEGVAQTIEIDWKDDDNKTLMQVANASNTQTKAGSYQVEIQLNDKTNYKWKGETGENESDNIKLDWTIAKKKLTKPTAVEKTYVYDGKTQELVFNGFDSNTMKAEEHEKMLSGSYTAKIQLQDTANYEWEGETEDEKADPTYNWTIGTIAIRVKTNPATKEYDGEALTITDYSVTGVFILGDSLDIQVNNDEVNVYSIEKPASGSTCYFKAIVMRGTTDVSCCYTFTWDAECGAISITPRKLMVVWGSTASFVYNGKEQVPAYTLVPENTIKDNTVKQAVLKAAASAIKLTGNADVGEKLTAKLTLQSNNFTFTEDGKNKLEVTSPAYEITAKSVTIQWADMVGSTITYTYDGTPKKSAASVLEAALCENEKGEKDTVEVTVTGEATKAGSYTFTASSENPNYQITNPTTTYTINKAKLTKPTLDSSETLYYNGDLRKTPLRNFDAGTMEITGNEQRACGTYIAHITLKDKDNYTWADGSQSQINIPWTINKTKVTISAGAVTKYYNGQSAASDSYIVESGTFAEGEGVASFKTEIRKNGEKTDAILVGEYDNIITECTLTNPDNYEVTLKNGVVTVAKAAVAIVVTSPSDTKKYDGTALSHDYGVEIAGAVASGEKLVVKLAGASITNAGTVANAIASVQVLNAKGEDVTDCYNITRNEGTLTVTAREITVKVDGAEKVYDGTALTCDTYTVTGDGFLAGEGFQDITVMGSQTLPGSSENTAKYTLNANTKTVNYTITVEPGTLTVQSKDEKTYDADLTCQYASCTVYNDLAFNYIIPASALEGYNMDSVYLEVRKTVEKTDGSKTETVTQIKAVKNGANYKFIYAGVAASQVGCRMEATLYGKMTGSDTLVQGKTLVYNVRDYLYNCYNSTGNEKLKDLIVNLLNYATLAQEYFGVKTAEPINSKLSEDKQQATLNGYTEATKAKELDSIWAKKEKEGDKTFYGVSCVLGSTINIKVFIDAASVADVAESAVLKVTYVDVYGDEQTMYIPMKELSQLRATVAEGSGTAVKSFYTYEMDKLTMRQLGQVVNFTVVDSETETEYSNTLAFSIEHYAAGQLKTLEGKAELSEREATLRDLLYSMVVYSRSTEAYFSQK